MENTERGETQEILETAAVEEEQQETKTAARKRRKKNTGKNRSGLKVLLLFLQHAALAIMVFAVIVVTVSTTVRIEGVHSNGSYSYIRSSVPGTPFEESDAFNYIFGYAVADVIRFGVVSSQMETKGVFDGDKLVDVTAYNNRNSGLPEEYVTVSYRLEDLLKWQSYGFIYNTVDMTGAEAADFLADTTQVTTIDPKSGYRNTVDANYLKSDVKDYTVVNGVTAAEETSEVVVEFAEADEDSGFVAGYQPAGALGDHATNEVTLTQADESPAVAGVGADEPEVYEYDVLVNRYKTADDKNLEEYVSDWEQYYELCHNVQKAAESLAYNYNEYLEYRDFYDLKNSNVRFLIEKTVGGKTQYYSNVPENSAYRKRILQMMDDEADVTSEKFIYYSLADMAYMTNTTIEAETVRQMLLSYDYAYPESVRIWIDVDGSYPAQDAFTQGARYLPNLWLWVTAAFLAGILYLILFVCQTVMTGRLYDENGEKRIRLTAFDRVPTEGGVLIAIGTMLLALWMAIVLTELANIDPTDLDFYREAVHKDWFKAVVFIGVFAADALFTFFFYSLVRRIKARTLWKNSWLCRLVKRLMKFAWMVYDNGGIVLRTWVPYGVFLLFNFIVLRTGIWIGTFGNGGTLLVLFGGIVDVIVGILLYKDAKERQGIVEGIETITGGQVDYQIDTEELHGDNRTLANSVNSIGKGIKEAVEISMKDERMKADLITNVSHDIKTPLTSIINYVDLIKREQVDNEKVQNYIRVLDEKSQRLKQLTDDLVEASKITSGNISLHFERINLTELMNQTIGEFSEKFDTKNLTTVMNVNTRDVVIEADSRRIWRVVENLFSNVYKYAMPGTRVYVTLDKAARSAEEETDRIKVTIKNISENPLLCKPEELTERFIRGDESRTTEGSGLGLSIAQNLTIAQRGSFEIELDGDLFKVHLTFPTSTQPKGSEPPKFPA